MICPLIVIGSVLLGPGSGFVVRLRRLSQSLELLLPQIIAMMTMMDQL